MERCDWTLFLFVLRLLLRPWLRSLKRRRQKLNETKWAWKKREMKLTLALILKLAVCSVEHFSSMAHVTHLLGIETEQIDDVKVLIRQSRDELDKLEELLGVIERERPGKLASAALKAEHLKYPLNQFRIIRRFDRMWPQVRLRQASLILFSLDCQKESLSISTRTNRRFGC